jgi:hypothetical protein
VGLRVCGSDRREGVFDMTRTLTVLAAVLVALVSVAAASGGKPIREPIFYEDFVLEGVCPFPVLVETTANKEYVKIFDDRIMVNGKLFTRLTNLETQESLELNISGPATISTTEVLRGRGLLILFPEDAGGPGLVLTAGRVQLIRGEDGFIANSTTSGRTVDVCAALAG